MTSAFEAPGPTAASWTSWSGVGAASWRDRYFAALLLAIAGYATLGKGFAYAGIPPLFPAEMLLGVGLATLVWPRPGTLPLFSLPMALMLAGIIWTVLRTLPFLSLYGIDALRDSVILVYGLFAIVTANLLLERPRRIGNAVRWIGTFVFFYALVIVPIYAFETAIGEGMPVWPLSGAPILLVRGGEIGVHLCAAVVFALLGFRRFHPVWIALLAADVAFVASLSRGGLVSIVLPALAAVALSGRVRPLVNTALVILPVLALLYTTGAEIALPGIKRSVDVGQLVDNVVSIAGSSGDSGLDDTKAWRLAWWDKIFGYTLHGDYFWTGKGFGINLALDDGFTTFTADGPLLRSPHNGNMTILARAGVPGLAIWVAILVSWFATMLWYVVKARRAGDRDWSHWFIFLFAYLLSAYIDASFDVALEGPLVGVVFWVLFGAGIGSAMVYDRLAPS